MRNRFLRRVTLKGNEPRALDAAAIKLKHLKDVELVLFEGKT
jgi:hypothetical protein